LLNGNGFINNEYVSLFRERIEVEAERTKKLTKIQEDITNSKDGDIRLLLDNNAMTNELKSIDEYLSSQKELNEETKPLHKLLSLAHKRVVDLVQYGLQEKYIVPPIFSECALKILEDFYRQDIFDIDRILVNLNNYCFNLEHFYLYFYWTYINYQEKKDESNASIIAIINSNASLKQRIIDSINSDVLRRFKDEPISYFEGGGNCEWVTPFLYYFGLLLNKTVPDWL